MPIYRLKNSGEWRKLAKVYRLKNNGTWRSLSAIYRLKNNGTWKKVFSGAAAVLPTIEQGVTISQGAPNPTTGLITLTGTNYHWTNITSLTYLFEWSSNNGTSWTTVKSGSISNPSSGSLNTETYQVSVGNTAPNTDNLYRFVVTGTNANGSVDSTSNNTIIRTPRNIVWSSPAITNITSNSATVNFSGGLYSNSYKVRIVNTDTNTTTNQTIAGSPGNLTGLTQNTNYTVYITGYTGSSANGYPGNESAGQSFKTLVSPLPVQVTAPAAPAGNGLAFTPMASGASGTYNNIVGLPTTVLITLISTATPTNGSTTAEGTVRPELYEVTQDNADFLGGSRLSFYTRDAVVGLNGFTYYYYSTPVIAYIGTVTDNFNRSVASGLGTSSSSYVYSSYSNLASSWSVNGSTAINNTNVSLGAAATSHPMQTLEVNNPNRTYKISIPDGLSGGIGVSYWVTSSGSWWATVPFYSASTSNITTYACGGSGSGSSCPDNFTTEYNADTVGRRCSACTNSQSTVYGCFDTGASSNCPDNFTTEYNSSTVGRRCGSCTASNVTTYGCFGSGSGSSCPNDFTSTYSAATVGRRCSACTTSEQTVYGCGGSVTGAASCPTDFTFEYNAFNLGKRCSSCTTTTTTTYSCGNEVQTNADPGVLFVCNSAANVGKPCSKFNIGGNVWLVAYCQSATSTTYAYSTVNSSTVTTFNYSTVSSVTETVNTYSTVGSTVVTTYSYSTVNSTISQATSYFTFLNILNNGVLVQTKEINKNIFPGVYSSAGYSRVYSHSTSINNNIITAKGFNASGVQIGTDFVYDATPNSPQKTGVLGDTSAGIIKARSADLVGNSYDDLLIQ